MAKTLVVKLAGTVDNDGLPYLGGLRFTMLATGNRSQTLHVASENVKLLISGGDSEAHFTNSDGTQNLGREITLTKDNANIVYVSPHQAVLDLLPKYELVRFVGSRGNNVVMDLEQLAYTKKLLYLDLTGQGRNITGNIQSLAECTSLKVLYMGTLPEVTGDISSLSGLSSLEDLHLYYTGVTGDISSVAGLTNLSSLRIQNIQITGDISSIAGLTNLTSLDVYNCRNLTGNTSSLAHLHPNNGGKLATFNRDSTGITGSWPPASA